MVNEQKERKKGRKKAMVLSTAMRVQDKDRDISFGTGFRRVHTDRRERWKTRHTAQTMVTSRRSETSSQLTRFVRVRGEGGERV